MTTDYILSIKYENDNIKYYINEYSIKINQVIDNNTLLFIKFYIINDHILTHLSIFNDLINNNKPLIYIYNDANIEENVKKILTKFNYKPFGNMNNIYFHPSNNELLISYNISLLYNTIFVFWTGNNNMSNNRINSLKTIEKYTNGNIVLITSDNLQDYVINNHPIHKTYPYLHYYHRADYLRCYFMHHYGGGYTDIKRIEQCWIKHFYNINNANNIWIIGYQELESGIINDPKSIDANTLKENYHKIVGNGAFICKNNTKFTSEWYKILNHRLTQYYNMVFHKFPIPNDNEKTEKYVFINKKKYKLNSIIHWTNLLGDIIQPLLLKYNEKVNQDLQPPIFKNYR